MAEFKKMFLISEVDYKLLKKAKGETSVKDALSSVQDIDVKNNLDLNKKLMQISKNDEQQNPSVEEKAQNMDIDESLFQDSLNETINSEPEPESQVEPEVSQEEAEQRVYAKLRAYLPPKEAERGIKLAKRIFVIDSSSINWHDQTIYLDKFAYTVMQFMDIIQLATSRKKPVQTDLLRDFCHYLSQNNVPTDLLTNTYMRTSIIASNIAAKIEESPSRGAAAAMHPKLFTPERMKNFKWFNTKEEIDFDESDE